MRKKEGYSSTISTGITWRTRVIWIIVFVCFAIIAGWKFGWKPFQQWLVKKLIIEPLDDMAGEGSYRISPGLIIHKTSATTYTLHDSDSFGVVYGELVGIYYKKSARLIIVSYVPFEELDEGMSSAADAPLDALSYAYGFIDSSGDLAHGKMEPLHKGENSELVINGKTYTTNVLTPIDTWYRRRK